MKLKQLILFTGLLVAFSSCNKCYNCELISDCATCTAKDANGQVLDPGKEVCGEEKEIDEYEAKYKSDWASFGGTASCQRYTKVEEVTEVCDKPAKAKDRVTVLEMSGHTCVAQ